MHYKPALPDQPVSRPVAIGSGRHSARQRRTLAGNPGARRYGQRLCGGRLAFFRKPNSPRRSSRAIAIGGSAMKRLRNIVIGAVSVFALSALPLHLDLGTLGSYDLSSAQAAKGGNGGGGGNGNGGGKGGGGGGNGNGHSGGNGKGGKAGGSSHATKAGGKSASAADHSRSLFSKGRARSGKVTQKSKSSSQLAEKRGSTSKAKVAKEQSRFAPSLLRCRKQWLRPNCWPRSRKRT